MKISLSKFGTSNESLKYLENRIVDDNYRGDVSSQHNRWTFDDLVFVLGSLQKYRAGDELLKIRTTDKSKRPANSSEEFDFASFCDEVVSKIGKGTQDAMRKNWFVDWHRAGWIERYNNKKEIVAPYDRSQISYVKISEEGLKLLSKTSTRTDRYFVFSKGIDQMYNGTIGILLDLFRNYDIKHIDLQEFTYFVTGVSSNGSFSISRERCVELINAWRRLTPMERRNIDDYFSKALVPRDSASSKTEQRDYHNWINKTQQTFSLLKQTIYFEQVNHLKFSHFNRLYYLGNENVAGDEFSKRDVKRLNRSLQQKHDYFKQHSVSKRRGFELHHIVALAWAESQHDFKMLDDWRNMIYIDGFTHAQITQNRNLNVKIEVLPPEDLKLVDYSGGSLVVKYLENALYSKVNLPIMLDYNKDLLKQKVKK
jgi:hypothetical protein